MQNFSCIKQPQTDWGNNIFKPISIFKIQDKFGNIGQGCCYCHEDITFKVFEKLLTLKNKNLNFKILLDKVINQEMFPCELMLEYFTKDLDLGFLDGLEIENLDQKLIFSAFSGIDTALWDLRSKQKNVSLCEVALEYFRSFSSSSSSQQQKVSVISPNDINCYCTVKLDLNTKNFKNMIKNAIDPILAKNFKAIKVYVVDSSSNEAKFGNFAEATKNEENEENFQIFEILRNYVGPEIKLMLDAQGFLKNWLEDNFWTKKLMEKLKILNFIWIEEPTIPGRLDLARELKVWNDRDRPTSSLKISGCESLQSFNSFKTWIDANSVDIIQPDMALAGGFSVLIKLKEYIHDSQSNKIQLIPHGYSCPLGSIQDAELARLHFGSHQQSKSSDDFLSRLIEIPEHVLGVEYEGKFIDISVDGKFRVSKI